MSSDRPAPPFPDRLVIALVGKTMKWKNYIGNIILQSKEQFASLDNMLVKGENDSYVVFNTPDFLDEDCQHLDQQIIDFMALSLPGPDLFILIVDSESCTEENVVTQITNLQEIFGEKITDHLVVMLPSPEVFNSLIFLQERFKVRLVIPDQHLSSICRRWCKRGQPFLYNFHNYSEAVVKRRQKVFERKRSIPEYETVIIGPAQTGPSTQHPAPTATNGTNGNIFNIIILGLAGTGKSETGNTILTAAKSDGQLFKAEASSVPITFCCTVRSVNKIFGVPVRVVDTPDFFHEDVKDAHVHINECRKYCQPGQCVVLLVIQGGRFTNQEIGILERLEDCLGWNIRDCTIVLLTRGDDMKNVNLWSYISENPGLKHIVEHCGNRFHLFNNKSKDIKQVLELVRKIPNYKSLFPKFAKKYDKDSCNSS